MLLCDEHRTETVVLINITIVVVERKHSRIRSIVVFATTIEGWIARIRKVRVVTVSSLKNIFGPYGPFLLFIYISFFSHPYSIISVCLIKCRTKEFQTSVIVRRKPDGNRSPH